MLPGPWPYPITNDINEARRWARKLAAETGDDHALYYRGTSHGMRACQPLQDNWSAAPLAADPRRDVLDIGGPCEIYLPDGRACSITIMDPWPLPMAALATQETDR